MKRKLVNKLLQASLVLATVVTMTTYIAVTEERNDSNAKLLEETTTEYGTTAGVNLALALSLDDAQAAVVSSNVTTVAENYITDVEYTRYVTDILNVRQEPSVESEVIGRLLIRSEVTVTGEVADNEFVRIDYNGQEGYVHSDYLSEQAPEAAEIINYSWNGEMLTKRDGTVQGPSGKETYYNLNMSRCVSIMKSNGYDGDYWVRSDGCKMFGSYIMVAANLSIRPRGTLVETSRGTGIVVDTGGFAQTNPYQLDVAVNW